jgi:hypothetical protein
VSGKEIEENKGDGMYARRGVECRMRRESEREIPQWTNENNPSIQAHAPFGQSNFPLVLSAVQG